MPDVFRVAVVAAILPSLHSLTASADEFRCEVTEKYVCEARAACKPAPRSVWNAIDMNRKTFARCDTRGCDTYDARFSPSGSFINIEVPGRACLLRCRPLVTFLSR
jgi:hypothetical protein